MTKKKGSRTRGARQRRQKQRRKNQQGLLLSAIVIVAVVAAAVVVVSNQPVEAYIAEDLSARYENITRSFSVKGYPQLGELDAPVTLEEYASFSCPGCEALHEESFDSILERVRAGQALYSYVPMQTGSVPNAEGAARAALCAGRQGKFWEMHDVLFDWQTRYVNTAFSQNRLLAGVEGLGLDSAAFTNCFNSASISDTLNSAITEDVSSTPTIHVNGVTITSQRTGGVPSTAEIMDAIEAATPKDWGMPEPAPMVEEEAVAPETEPASETPTEEPTAEAEEVLAADETPTGENQSAQEENAAGEAQSEAGDESAESETIAATAVAEAPEPPEGLEN